MSDHETGVSATNGGGQTPVLAMEGITKRFGDNLANDHINLDLYRGEVHGLLGENGAGKSTLMKILYGLYRADEGRVLLGGQAANIHSPIDAVSAGIGMVHQHYTLVPTLTVAENVVLGAEPRRAGILMDRDAATQAVSKLSEQYGLKVDPDARVGNLSVGLQQRVEILKALYRDARILILDEPTAVLTPQESEELFGVLRSFVDEGLSIILITHKLGELLGVSDRITVIRDGRVVDTVQTSQTTEAQLATLMVGRPVVLRADRPPATPGDVRLAARDLEVLGPTGQPAVRGIDLEVRGGEILAVAGVDGNGQVELAEALAGMRPAVAGTVEVDGQDVTALGAGRRADRGLAYIPEDRGGKGLIGPFTLAENCVLKRYDHAPYSSRGWLRGGAISRYARERITAFDVRPADEHATASSLSGGNQQKTIVARELDGDPAVLIANQPTRGVDVGAIEFIHRQLIAQRDRGAAILLISLELDEIHQLADRIIVLYGGRVFGEVPAEEATDEQLGLWMAGQTQEASG